MELIEIRSVKYGKRPFPADMLLEAKYDGRYVIPAWKFRLIRLFL